ncbi:tRNA (cytidine(34)-2'-O)-methyltransferase [Spirochaetota bacterium]|nr:tRNA (cytidine(34)-2'-O)-methyltransferase [Spirochaetota bacterium]
MIQVVLYEPEIPPNTGNIGRLCVGFKVPLVLIEPLGFSLADKALKRAGLDYWDKLDYKVYPKLAAYFNAIGYISSDLSSSDLSSSDLSSSDLSSSNLSSSDLSSSNLSRLHAKHTTHNRVICLSKYGTRSLYEWQFSAGDTLLFGNEISGIPLKVTQKYSIERFKLPMAAAIRSYNLANAVAMALGEAYRQLKWPLIA